MKNLGRLTFLAALLVGTFSCTDLEEDLKDSYTADFDPENPGVGIKNNVNKATPNDGLNAAFARLNGGTAWHGSYFSMMEISSDEAVITQKGGDWFDGGVNLVLHTHTWTPTNDFFNNAWGDIYGGIFQCNDLLEDFGTDLPKAAQLRTLRAYFLWRAMDAFGRVKVPTTAGVDVPQGTRLAAYNFIISELTDPAVVDNLPAGKQEYGRCSQGTVYALLARLYLNSNIYKTEPNVAPPAQADAADLQKAIDAADMVINSGVYSLSSSYAAVFAPDNVENVEHILVFPYDESTGGGMNFAQMTLHYPSQLTFKLQQQPWNGYSTLEEFYNSYEASDARRANNFIAGPQVDLADNPILDLAFDKEDPDGAEINYTPFVNELAPNGSRQAGARLGKFSFKIGQGTEMDNDFPVLRYGEVLLNKAEALARLNGYGDATAKALVDQLRTRAGVGSIGTLTEASLLAERGRELFQESLRRPDLIRFGKWGAAWWEKPAHNQIYRNVFPIPQNQINATTGSANPLTQNPGY